jgi:formate dehydrogenase subunit gamma
MTSASNDAAPEAAQSQQQVLEQACDRYGNDPALLIPILHEIQRHLGYIPDRALPWLAGRVQRSRAEIQGVISFYHDFRSTPPPATQLRVCMAESCLAMGAGQLYDHACQHLGVSSAGPHGTRQEQAQAEVNAVYCLGLCAQSPAIELNGQQYARVSTERLNRLLDAQQVTP